MRRPAKHAPFNRIPEKWPVIYLVDGNQYFGMVTDMIRPMSWCGQTSDAMVVGIGYPESSDAIATFRDILHAATPI